MPQTATAKVLKAELRRQKFCPDRCPDPLYWRPRPDQPYRRFTAADHERVRAQFERVGKLALLDL